MLIDPQQHKHLWVYGKPGIKNSISPPTRGQQALIKTAGAGKSVLSSFVITELRKYSETELRVLHFFCKDGDPDASTAAAIASSFIDQLIEHNPLSALFSILKQARAKHARSDKCTDFIILWNIFVAMVQVFPTRIVAVVDALDECHTDRALLLDWMASSPAADTQGNLRFFLTSREEYDISSKLANHSGTAPCAMSVEEDIKEFVVQRLPELRRLEHVLARAPRLKERIIEDVPKHAAGMFRYAALILNELNSPDIDVAKMLDLPPYGLFGMYQQILLRPESPKEGKSLPQSRETRKKLLYWVAMAKRPLTVIELAYYCAVRDDEDGFDPATGKRTHIDMGDIMEICGPLIEIVDDTVQFTHWSVKEFLLKSGDFCPGGSQIQYYLVNLKEAQVAIAITCGM